MKKSLSLLLALVICLSLCACGQTTNHQSEEPGKNNNETKGTTTEKKETVIVDNENYKITIVDRSFKKESGNSDVEVPTLAMIIENKTNLDWFNIFSKTLDITGFFGIFQLNCYVFSLVFALMSRNKGNFLYSTITYLIKQSCGSALGFPG